MDTTTLTNDIENELINNLVVQIKNSGKRYRKLMTYGRGGLSILQKLAYKLDITDIDIKFFTPDSTDVLFVDDISCTGTTLGRVECDTATLVYRTTSKVKPTFFALEVNSAKYIKFSWEK